MKSITVIVIGLCILIGSSLVHAEDIHGIYAIDGDINQLVSVHQKGDKVVVVSMNNYWSLFDILIGSKKEKYVQTIYGFSMISASYTILKLTKNSFIVKQDRCEPRYSSTYCIHENGDLLVGDRVF